KELQKLAQALQNEADQLEAELHRALSTQLGDKTKDTDSETIQRQLSQGAALVEFVHVPLLDFKATGKQPRWKPPHYFAFVLSAGKDAPRFIDLGAAKPIDEAIAKLRQQIESAPRNLRLSSEKDVEAEFRTASQALYRLAFAPLRAALGKSGII